MIILWAFAPGQRTQHFSLKKSGFTKGENTTAKQTTTEHESHSSRHLAILDIILCIQTQHLLEVRVVKQVDGEDEGQQVEKPVVACKHDEKLERRLFPSAYNT